MKRLLAFVLLLSLFSLSVSAHPGGTDANGGHHSGSSYHYHHGYPAHQHTDGVCPYDFKNNVKPKDNSSTTANQADQSPIPASASQKKDSILAQIFLAIGEFIFAIFNVIPNEILVICCDILFVLLIMVIISGFCNVLHFILVAISNIYEKMARKKYERAAAKARQQTDMPAMEEKKNNPHELLPDTNAYDDFYDAFEDDFDDSLDDDSNDDFDDENFRKLFPDLYSTGLISHSSAQNEPTNEKDPEIKKPLRKRRAVRYIKEKTKPFDIDIDE